MYESHDLCESDRFVSEGTALFLLHGDNLYEEERRESNKLPHRRKKLEDIILKYQTDKKGISEEEYSLRFQKIYGAIDAATEDIDTWQTSDKYAYYRMDLQLWSNYKYNENEKFKEYDKYSDITVVSKELEELWEFLCNHDGKDIEEFSYQSSLFHRYCSIVPYTCTVLLRDFDKDLTDSDRDLCTHIIFELGYLFSQISDFEYRQANAIEAVTHGLILLLNEENRKTVNN